MKRKISKRKSIFEFNHIDKSLSEEQYQTITDFYKHYHKKHWCYKRCYKSYKFLDNFFLFLVYLLLLLVLSQEG